MTSIASFKSLRYPPYSHERSSSVIHTFQLIEKLFSTILASHSTSSKQQHTPMLLRQWKRKPKISNNEVEFLFHREMHNQLILRWNLEIWNRNTNGRKGDQPRQNLRYICVCSYIWRWMFNIYIYIYIG